MDRLKHFFTAALCALLSGLLVAGTAPAWAQDGIPVAGPNLDGDAYTALRGDSAHQTIGFKAVTKSRASTQTREVQVGPDYVLEQEGDTLRLYDFRLRRLLTLFPDAHTFTNESLYGHARTRFAFLQNNLATAGMGIASGLMDKQQAGTLRFVNEHLNGIAHPREIALTNLPKPVLSLVRDGAELTGTLPGIEGDVPVLSASLSPWGFPSDAHNRAFRAWLVWSGRMHPQAVEAITATGHIPARIAFTFPAAIRKMNPNIQKEQVLTFLKPATHESHFDMLRGWAAKLPVWAPYLPEALAETMVQAANGTAANGPRSDDDFIAEMTVLMEAERYLDAVLVALHASHPYDGCLGEHRTRALCTVMGGVINQARVDPDVRKLFDGFAQEKEGEYRAAAQTWVTLRVRELVRIDVLDFMIANALVEAHKKVALDGQMGTAFAKLPELFTRALAADPYDPARYRDIFNYLNVAATGLTDRYTVPIQSQAVIDLALALPDRPTPKIIAQVVESNARIADDFPILFPTFDPR